MCNTLNPLFEEHFPASSGVRIIGEPGRYYSASALTLAVNVFAKREVPYDQLQDKDKNKLASLCCPKEDQKVRKIYHENPDYLVCWVTNVSDCYNNCTTLTKP